MIGGSEFNLVFDKDTNSEKCHFEGDCSYKRQPTDTATAIQDDTTLDQAFDLCEKYSSKQDRLNCEFGSDIAEMITPLADSAILSVKLSAMTIGILSLAVL